MEIRGAGPVHLPEAPAAYDGAVPFFRALNRWVMVPLTRRGLGAWVSTPFGGAILLLRVRGRKSGAIRETPLNYVIADGAAWVLAGLGTRTEWYRNLQVDPAVEVLLPGGRRFRGVALDVRDPDLRERMLPAILRSTLGPSLGAGINPFAPPGELAATMAWVPLLRLEPEDGPLEAGPDDPGGHGWIWRQALLVVVTIVAWRLLRSPFRRGQ